MSFLSFAAAHPAIFSLSLHDALPIWARGGSCGQVVDRLVRQSPVHQVNRTGDDVPGDLAPARHGQRSEEHTSELQSRGHLVCRLLLEKKKQYIHRRATSHDEIDTELV